MSLSPPEPFVSSVIVNQEITVNFTGKLDKTYQITAPGNGNILIGLPGETPSGEISNFQPMQAPTSIVVSAKNPSTLNRCEINELESSCSTQFYVNVLPIPTKLDCNPKAGCCGGC